MRITGAVLREMGRERPYAGSRPLAIEELELDEPGPGEVLIRLTAAGVCHSDLSVVDGNRPRPLPMLLGHEGAGIVETLGPGVDDLSVGQSVVTVFLPRCGECANCRTDGKLPCTPGSATNAAGTLPFDGHEVRLHDASGTEVLHHLGASVFATHAVVNRASLVPIGADVPAPIAAVLGCAVLTGGGAVLNAGAPRAQDEVMIVGLGGVGMAALLTALSIETAGVIGVDANPDKLERARELGATEVFTPDQLGDRKAAVVVECAGHPRAFETAFTATAVGGTTVTVGLPAPDAVSRITPVTLTAEARTVIGSYLGSAVSSRDIPVYAQLWREGKLPVEELISDTIGLHEINAAFDALAEGTVVRQIIDFRR
ncbi:alcohol dehydrogenase [Brevibacterium sanguinis]|uniref:Alcohol dehydrogenase n=2 Tax=Brevibacterium TaxID=1696 RepID=A0A366IL12_9MICO|nr:MULTISPECIES: alcohol dehydrogenase catalytic domain-containing protein [Brevibacterium]RBP66471.1 alcohol dehydrogenase [Brevibacterium sanguinis]RBP73123.1 alcohol dehydrogenase [Brevibacterium celere]